MSLSDREFLGDSTEPKREGMSYQTAVKIMVIGGASSNSGRFSSVTFVKWFPAR